MADNEELNNDAEIQAAAADRRILPLPEAIKVLAPNCSWNLPGYTYEDLVWTDDIAKKPSKEAVIAKAEEILAEVPWKRLRRERAARMRDVDWVTLKAVRTGEEISQEWKDYMQALADITETTTNPQIVGGVLLNVEWPVRPDGVETGPYRGESPLSR